MLRSFVIFFYFTFDSFCTLYRTFPHPNIPLVFGCDNQSSLNSIILPSVSKYLQFRLAVMYKFQTVLSSYVVMF